MSNYYKFLVFVILVKLCFSAQMSELEPPNLLAFGYGNFQDDVTKSKLAEVSWVEVVNADDNDPILGYKLYVWEVPKIKTKTVYEKDKDGKLVPHEKEVYEELDFDKVPDSVPMIYTTNSTTVLFPIKPDIMYQYAGKTFSKSRESKFSYPVRVKV